MDDNAIPHEDVRGTWGSFSFASSSGLEMARAFARGDYPYPPIHHLTGLTPTEAGLGSMTFSMPVSEWFQDASGIIWGGIYPLLVDAPISMSLFTGLPAGKALTTSELSINYLRPPTLNSGTLVGRARSVYLGREVGVAEATVEDGKGRTMAHATTRCVILDIPEAQLEMPEPEPVDTTLPDPYLRPIPEGALVGAEVWDRDKLSVQRRFITGDLPSGPIQLLIGFEFVSIDEGNARFKMPCSPWFSAGSPFMYGGLLALACDCALAGVVWTTLDADSVAASLDLQIRFLRPVPLDGSKLSITSSVRHSGRTIRVAEAEVFDAQGRRVAIATGSSMVIPGGIDKLKQGVSTEQLLRE